jgi:hypothetical protein
VKVTLINACAVRAKEASIPLKTPLAFKVCVVTLTLESRFDSPRPAATKPEGSQEAPLERLVQEGVVEVLFVSA